MTDKKDIKNKISSVIDSLKDLDTQAIEGQIDIENQLFDYSNLLANISDDPEIAIGAEIGHWKVVKLIGTGGMSIVYLVERNDEQLNQQAALKVIPNGLANKSMIDRFMRERQILSDLNHPNIAQLYDAGVTEQGMPWFVMEYIQGEDIITYAETKQLNIEQRIFLIKQVCEALAYAHAHGVVHRDIKPTNLMVNDDKTIKLLDFGIASSEEELSLTMTGVVIGTPGYMSPEQAKGLTNEIDRRSDIFSLGVLMYKLIKQDMPFRAESISEISYKIIHDEPTLLGNQIPVELQAVTFKCLEKKVEKRYSSMRRLQNDLDAYLRGDVVSARKVTFIGRVFKKIKKHPLISIFIILATLLTVLGIGYGIYQSIESVKKLQVSEKYLAKTQDLKAKIRRAHMMPLHDIDSEYAEFDKQIEQLRDEIESNDIDHSGLSYFALGEAYFNMKIFSVALGYFQKAETKGWQSRELDSGLGFTLLAKWTREKKQANSMSNKEEKQAFLDKLKSETYTPAIEYLKKAQIGASDVNFLAARLAYVEKDYDRTLEFADKEIKVNPWHYEALRLASEAYLFKFKLIGREKGYDVAVKYLDLSNQKLEQSIQIGRSDPFNYTSRCSNASAEIQLKKMLKLNEELIRAFEKGVQYCQAALILKPLAHSPWANLNILYSAKASFLESQGESAVDTYKEALKATEDGLKIHPEDFYLLGYKIKPLLKLADDAISRNKDPGEYYLEAMQSAELSLKINPSHAHTWTELAGLQTKQAGNYIQLHKNYTEAEKYYNSAKESFEKKIALEYSIESVLSIAEIEYSLHDLKILQGLSIEAIQFLQQSVEHRIEVLPARELYFDHFMSVLESLKLLIETKTFSKKNIETEIQQALNIFNMVCQFKDLVEKQKHTLKINLQIYTDNNWINQNQLNQCQN